jgi:hypothetical protein
MARPAGWSGEDNAAGLTGVRGRRRVLEKPRMLDTAGQELSTRIQVFGAQWKGMQRNSFISVIHSYLRLTCHEGSNRHQRLECSQSPQFH